MKLIFERSVPGLKPAILPALDVPEVPADAPLREKGLHLPSLSEGELSRHYSALARQVFGVNDGFYPLGSCTMKYNPKLNEKVASMPGFRELHPLMPAQEAQGVLAALAMSAEWLCEVTGMDRMTFQPAAGAQGEWLGLLLIKKYHEKRGEGAQRTKLIVPDSAHGTNPASGSMAGFQVLTVATNEEGGVDLDSLRAAVDEHCAGLMLTNPSTYGLFEKDILAITQIIHEAGGLVYYDGANLNAIMGYIRPGDMGFDCVHLNLHKTFSAPHGGGGPGSGAVGCKAFLADYLPTPVLIKGEEGYDWDYDRPDSVGRMKNFYGHTLIVLRALTYMMTLGGDGLKEASGQAVLNANYMRHHLRDVLPACYDCPCMHEYVATMAALKKERGISALDLAKGMLDHHMYPPTMYFPLSVPEALMIEPTETESRATLDEVIAVYRSLLEKAKTDPDFLHQAPYHTAVKRLDEVGAARHPKLTADLED